MNILNVVNLGLGALRANVLRQRVPLNVMLSATNRCNSHCRYCDIPVRKQTELTPEQTLQLIDEMAEAGTKRLGIWGGEPLLRGDIAEIIAHARKHRMLVTLDTNGYLLPKRLHELSELNHVIVALDGSEPEHDANRGPGSFRKAMAGIEAALPTMSVWTITVLTRHNIDSIEYMVDTAERMGFMPTFQILHHNDELGRGRNDLLPSNDEYRAAIHKLKSLKRAGRRVGSTERWLEQMLQWTDYRITTRLERTAGQRCMGGQLYCNVDTDGTVHACSLMIGRTTPKNFLDVGFKAAFEAIPPSPCQSCVATCFTDYNFLFALDPRSTVEWARWMVMS